MNKNVQQLIEELRSLVKEWHKSCRSAGGGACVMSQVRNQERNAAKKECCKQLNIIIQKYQWKNENKKMKGIK